MHDPGDWFGLIAGAGVNGWCIYTVAIGCDHNDLSGQNFGVPGLIEPLARLNNGYAPAGTIPHPSRYADFAKRCANFVAASRGCRHWIIGNEISMNCEFPDGQPIRLSDYVQCFNLCRAAIKTVQPDAIVVPQAPAPYNDGLKYPGNERGDWCRQLTDMLNSIGVGNTAGFLLAFIRSTEILASLSAGPRRRRRISLAVILREVRNHLWHSGGFCGFCRSWATFRLCSV